MDGVIDAYFAEDIRILVSDPSKVNIPAIKATLAEYGIKPNTVAQVASL